ncbi:MAG: hypothetical protein ACOYLS_12115 [Polymorphobacter sp.]
MRRFALMLAMSLPGAAQAADCTLGPVDAATTNAASLETLEWAPFRRPELGWAIYAVKIAAEIGTRCPADTPGFAAALAQWQAAQRLPATGVVDIPGFAVMNARWTLARPFVLATRGGACPLPPAADTLAIAAPDESFGGKTIALRSDALAAYRSLRAAAGRELAITDPGWFRIFSGFRAPDADDLRCQTDGNCNGIVRATCSAHRTGLAIDLHVGHAPGLGPDSSDDVNRRAMVRTLAYRWLVTNAARFGFQNYVFEPWHWEWSPASTSPPPAAKTPA